jgi:hypothetical protein
MGSKVGAKRVERQTRLDQLDDVGTPEEIMKAVARTRHRCACIAAL